MSESHDPMFACPCCGYLTLPARSPSWATCPICWWTDDDASSPRRLDELIRAQEAFARDGASEPCWREKVRAPAGEVRDPAWRPHHGPSPRQERRADLIAAVEAAFRDVQPGSRLGLLATYRLDFHADPDVTWDDRDAHWAELPDEALDYFGTTSSVFSFGTIDDFRYYLPAFLKRSLQRDDPLPATMALAAPAHPERASALTTPQRAVIVAFLHYISTYVPHASWAETALRRWDLGPDQAP